MNKKSFFSKTTKPHQWCNG